MKMATVLREGGRKGRAEEVEEGRGRDSQEEKEGKELGVDRITGVKEEGGKRIVKFWSVKIQC